jgi:hypothetical protein
MKKSIVKTGIVLFALISIGLGVKAMLAMPTLILPSWFLALLYLPILLAIAFVLGIVVNTIIKIETDRYIYTALFAGLISLGFYFSEYKPTNKIIIPGDFGGQVRLFLSNEPDDDLRINNFGIGYISRKTYLQGFKPIIIQNGKDITKQVTEFFQGSAGAGTVDHEHIGDYKFLGFTIPGKPTDSLKNDLVKLIKLNALDTSRTVRE